MEPKSLVAGLSHWKFGRFDAFKVNPPLVRMVAALPVIAAGYQENWDDYTIGVGTNSGSGAAHAFIQANGLRTFRLMTLARWACIPFCLVGGVFCFLWTRELAVSDAAGLVALFLWAFDPNILAHGELVTSDCAAASFGVGAGYGFWRWLRNPSWQRAAIAGGLLGLAALTKLSWILLFGLWPLCWVLLRVCTSCKHRQSCRAMIGEGCQLTAIVGVALYAINVVYAFDGVFTRLGEFTFVSQSLTGQKSAREPGNRFADTWLGGVPLPLPRPFVEGIDIQKADFEDYSERYYLRGEWKQGGWWYYYLYALAVKVPHGTQLLLSISLLLASFRLPVLRSIAPSRVRNVLPRMSDLAVVLSPAILLIALASSHLEVMHFRYVLPAFGFLFIFIATTVTCMYVHKVQS
jgi:hypothetical protein